MRFIRAVIVSIAAQLAVSASAAGPSFRCTGNLKAAEQAICQDPELSAYDRAIAWAWTHLWKSSVSESIDQSGWLAQRDACDSRRACILSAYREWIGGLDVGHPIEPTFDRIERKPTYRNGAVSSGDWGDLSIVPLGEGWLLFRASGTHAYDPRDGRGPNASTSLALGVVHVGGGTGSWADDTCRLQFRQLSARVWRIIESGGGCSGIGSTLSGIYRKP